MIFSRNRTTFLAHLILFYFLGPAGTTVQASWGTSVDKMCQFECSNGLHPKPNPRYVATSNGCGVPGTQMPKLPDYIPVDKLEDCCSSHDICYGTCNADKNDCDSKFEHCLHSICSELGSRLPGNFAMGCKSVAKIMYTAVSIMGCKHYIDAQKEACICSEKSINYEL